MKKFQSNVEKNPLKYYSILILLFTLFFIGLILVIGWTTLISFNHLVETMFNSINMTVVSSNAQISPENNVIDLNFFTSLIALFGGFGGFCYVFFSIRDGKISDNLRYAFEGFLSIILFLDVLLFISLISGKWQTPKMGELIFLLAIPLIAIIFGYLFRVIFNTIEENYHARISIIKFLKKNDDNVVISPFIGNIVREINQNYETYSFYIFLVLVGMIFLGIFQNFNPLTIISSILFSFIIFIGFSRLIMLKTPTADIVLIRRQNPEILTPLDLSLPDFSNIFILAESSDYITILTNKNDEKKILSFSKNCICSVRDNWYEIYEERTHPIAVWFTTRAIRTLLSTISFYFIFVILTSFISTKQSWALFFIVLIVSLILGIYTIHLMKRRVDKLIETFLKIFY
jgi:hypothetical protein